MQSRRSAASILVMLMLVTACRVERTPRAGLADPTGVARAEVDTMLAQLGEALRSNDARRSAAFFVPAARLHLPGRPDALGRGAIDAAFAEHFAHTPIVDIEMVSDEIDISAGRAHQFGSFVERVATGDSTEQVLAGRFAIRWVRGPEETWQIERMLINHVPADSSDVQQTTHDADA